jgi:hypothetical protein
MVVGVMKQNKKKVKTSLPLMTIRRIKAKKKLMIGYSCGETKAKNKGCDELYFPPLARVMKTKRKKKGTKIPQMVGVMKQNTKKGGILLPLLAIVTK